jgi:hypothetical protein
MNRFYYTVWLTNVTECAVGIGDISWNVTVAAASESEALNLGLEQARALNREFGLPPNRIKVSDEELRSMAHVQQLRYL